MGYDLGLDREGSEAQKRLSSGLDPEGPKVGSIWKVGDKDTQKYRRCRSKVVKAGWTGHHFQITGFENANFKKQRSKGFHDPWCGCEGDTEWERKSAEGRKARVLEATAL